MPASALEPAVSGSILQAAGAASGGLPRQRILHVFRAPVGGLFRHVVDLARLQAAAGHAVGLVCDASTGGERAAQATGLPYCMSETEGFDANDEHKKNGLMAVSKLLMAVRRM